MLNHLWKSIQHLTTGVNTNERFYRLHDEMKESGMDLSDFIDSGSTY